jgi:RNA polymerase sigma-70 factor (ECF subfamily)
VEGRRAGAGSIDHKDPKNAQKGFTRSSTSTNLPRVRTTFQTERPAPEPAWDWRFARSRCLREARRLLRDVDDAEEAVQEAMARAWRRRRACSNPDDPLGWLLQITRNEALRVMERRSRRTAREVVTPVEPERAGAEPIDELLSTMATQQALARLRPDERALLHLRYRADLSQAEVARRLDMPVGTVKVRLHRIRKRLRHDWPQDNEAPRRDH